MERLPHPDESPVDPRLLAREAQAKIVGDQKVLSAIEQVELDAIAGFQYAQKELRVKAGIKISLTFPNLDPSMPYNVVIVQPDRFTTIMYASMKLSASPKGLAKHYLPEDKGALLFSPYCRAEIPI